MESSREGFESNILFQGDDSGKQKEGEIGYRKRG